MQFCVAKNSDKLSVNIGHVYCTFTAKKSRLNSNFMRKISYISMRYFVFRKSKFDLLARLIVKNLEV